MKKVGILGLWLAVLLLGAVGIWWFTQDRFMVDSEVARELAPMESTAHARAALIQALRAPGTAPTILIWGQFPEDREALDVLNLMWESRDEAGLRWDEIWLDEGFHDLLPGRPVYLRGADVPLAKELEALRLEGRSVLILTAPIFAATVLKGSPAAGLTQLNVPFQSVLWMEGPRRREEEKNIRPPCQLPHADLKGTGALGCRVLQSARGEYRRNFKTGERLMQIERLNANDLLVWRATEP